VENVNIKHKEAGGPRLDKQRSSYH